MNNTNNPNLKIGGIQETPLLFFQPFNIIVFLCFYSPVIVTMGVLGMSFIFQNFKGFIYLAFLLACCAAREALYKFTSSIPSNNNGTICTSIQYSKYGNPSFSAFVFAFTIMYISLPMFINGYVNFWIFLGLLFYFLIDMLIKIYKGCIINKGDLAFNILLGIGLSAGFVSALIAGGSGRFLFFNEVSSTREICSQPKEQTFKCSLYKNGELLSDIN
jgi:hypothetical protein